jgi:hypothetical protein
MTFPRFEAMMDYYSDSKKRKPKHKEQTEEKFKKKFAQLAAIN